MIPIDKQKIGLIAGNFDVLHNGYFRLFKDAKSVCDFLIVALHEDPSIMNTNKIKPIQTVEERIENLSSIKYIDLIVPYKFEYELDEIARRYSIDIRIVGSDYIDREDSINGKCKEIYFHPRTKWSATLFRSLIR